MGSDLQRQQSALGTAMSQLAIAAGATNTLNFQHNEYHGDVTNIQNNYMERYDPVWKPSRRCAPIDFERLSKHFCGCDRELEQIDSVLKPGEASHRCAIQGISGLGKSHLAIKYGKVSFGREKYTHVFWISADSEVKLLSGLDSILVKLDHPAQLESDRNAKIEIVRRWLEDAEEDQRWLLILDNVRRESFQDLWSKLPNNPPHGHILLTTQFDDVAKDFVKSQQDEFSLLRLHPLAIDDAVTLLVTSSEMSSEDFSSQDRDKARQLVQRTGCHPLAITFAAACATSIGTLPELLDWTSDDQLVRITEYEDVLAETDQRVIKQFFNRQIENIQDNSLALDLFRILSFLDVSSISINMLWRGILYWQEFPQYPRSDHDSITKLKLLIRRSAHSVVRALESSPVFTCRKPDLQKCIEVLARQNLIQMASSDVFSMHDLTNHLSVQLMGEADMKRDYQERACQLISSSLESIQDPSRKDEWPTSDKVIPHLLKLSSDTSSIKFLTDAELMESADYLYERGRYLEAQLLYDRLLIKQKKNHSNTHPDTLTSMHKLAMIYNSQERYGEAEELYQDVLAKRKKRLGPEHLDTLTTMHNLASNLSDQCRFEEAEALFLQVWNLKKKTLPQGHAENFSTMQGLAAVYKSQDRLEEAEKLHQSVLSEQEKQLGPEHPDTVLTKYHLASIHQRRGRFQEAQELYQHVLSREEAHYGPQDPTTLTTMWSLAQVYYHQGQYDEAEELLQSVWAERDTQLGSDHPSTLSALRQLAYVYQSQGHQEEADALFARVGDSDE